jgi:hypothetical protein
MRYQLTAFGLIAAAVSVSHEASAQGAYPEPPKATRALPITDQTIAQAQMTANPLSNFLRTSQGRYTLFPTATIVPPGGWTVEWPAPAISASEKYFVSWSKAGGHFWAVDCVTQRSCRSSEQPPSISRARIGRRSRTRRWSSTFFTSRNRDEPQGGRHVRSPTRLGPHRASPPLRRLHRPTGEEHAND